MILYQDIKPPCFRVRLFEAFSPGAYKQAEKGEATAFLNHNLILGPYRLRRTEFYQQQSASAFKRPFISVDEAERWAAHLPEFARTPRHKDILSAPGMNSDEFQELLRDFPGPWEVVPVHSIWEKQLLPLMKDPELFESYESAIDRFNKCATRDATKMQKPRRGPRWRYDPLKPPFMLTRGCGAAMHVDEQMEKAEEEADFLAVHYSKIWAVIGEVTGKKVK
jgi:hypothetical protein